MTEKPKKNHWYEMYKLECLKTKELQEELEYAKTHCLFHSDCPTQKENAELKAFKEKCKFNVSDIFKDIETENNLTKAKEIISEYVRLANLEKEDTVTVWQLYHKAEQFIKDKTETEQEEPYYVIMNMNCDYEICRKCPKSGLFKGTYEECENWIKEKLSEVEK